MPRPTNHAARNRASKVDRIVARLDANLLFAGRPVYGADLVSMLQAAPERFWVDVQSQVGGDVASPETRALVVARYQYRTEGAAMAVAS